ncbi:hypothetical protein L596_005774 [Steinernema carpocapsae]|uniref:Secreted protein n=1 Tax=Steinernema carpocapsae TaxID=34508 RepID=A0A4U8V033_STECR|nr:hypothetical protein L596_005774 [Steinernema carpocapsae]
MCLHVLLPLSAFHLRILLITFVLKGCCPLPENGQKTAIERSGWSSSEPQITLRKLRQPRSSANVTINVLLGDTSK